MLGVIEKIVFHPKYLLYMFFADHTVDLIHTKLNYESCSSNRTKVLVSIESLPNCDIVGLRCKYNQNSQWQQLSLFFFFFLRK